MIVGWFSLTIGSVLSAALATWVMNGGYTSLYYDFGRHGALWTILELPVVFVATDYTTYWLHRIYHMPFLYKVAHYKAPSLLHLIFVSTSTSYTTHTNSLQHSQ